MRQNLKKVSSFLKEKLGKIFIICGLFLLLGAVFMKIETKQKQEQKLQMYEDYITSLENIQKDPLILQAEGLPKQEEIEDVSYIGILSIPSIDVYTIIEEGTDKETLKYSVGHFVGTAMPGERGNCAITGHRSYSYGEYFNRLDELKEEEIIIIKRGQQEFYYRVNEIFIVEPTEVSVLENTTEATLTLITCTPVRIGTNRLIIKATLEEKIN